MRSIKASLFLAFGALGVFGAQSVYAPQEAFAQASATNGSLRGVLKDKTNNEAAIGATVVATSPALVGEQVVITDETGQYFLSSLPPGVYTLTIYYENKTFSRQNVLIQLGKEAVVNVTVDPKAAGTPIGPKGTEIINVTGSVPIIDQGSTKTGIQLTDDYTRNIPTGRTFGGVLGSAAGSQGDLYGTSISGATSAENVYVVEGINTTDTGFGGISTNLPNEFIAETEVITGGYNAEFGRATGGIVNVVTKQGSNKLKGSVFGYFKPGAFVASAKKIQREGGSIDSETNLNYAADFGAEIGGPIIKDKLWFHVGFNPSLAKSTVTRSVNSQVDVVNNATGMPGADGIPDIDPTTGFTVHEQVGTPTDLTNQAATYFFTAKINGAINQNNQFQISAFGNPSTSDPVFALQRNPLNTQYHSQDGAYDFAGKFTSKLNEGKTQIDAVIGFHRGYENQLPRNSAQDVPFIRYNLEQSLFKFAALEGGEANIAKCNDADPNDPYPMIRNCPVVQYGTQGLGFLEERTNDRTSAIISVTQRVKALGYHTFKAGVDAEFATYNSTRRHSGGALMFKRQNDAPGRPGSWQLREFMKVTRNITDEELAAPNFPDNLNLGPNDTLCGADRAICSSANRLQADTNNTGIAAFIQDSWQIRPNFTLNLGLRYEQMTGFVAKALQGTTTSTGEIVPDAAYKLNNLIAPRIGFIYDPTKEGKAKIFGHWGRFYEAVPMDLNVRAFGGEITNFTLLNANRVGMGAPNYDPNCDVDFTGREGEDLSLALRQCTLRRPQALLGQGLEFVTNLEGQYTQELIAGAEYELIPNMKVGINYIHRTMPQVIEDVSTDGGNNYLITNPGTDLSAQAAEIKAEAIRLMGTGNAEDAALAQVLLDRAASVAYVGRFDKPTRNYDAVQLTATQRPTSKSLLIASYTYSVSKGNYPGLFSTETGQLDPNLTSLYDLPDLMANRYGFLGLDRPHNLKIDGFYQFDLKKAGLLTAGASLRVLSGIAHNALGTHPTYGNGESYLLPRGAFERSPVTTQLDAHFSYGYRLSKTTTLEGFVRIFNLINSQDELNVDEIYTFDNSVPIVGGDPSDLAHLKGSDGSGSLDGRRTVTPNKNFGNVNSQQAPRNVQLGFRLTF
ncbi:MAG: TonB-dependent receptor [Deltaproteobacteria bacterium]|nr:TonB-dependent receptor [Deltaproteobacteria bacterium]MCW5805217.1 TonB-dependent receptor [Deltaproteobacteria bacterium]